MKWMGLACLVLAALGAIAFWWPSDRHRIGGIGPRTSLPWEDTESREYRQKRLRYQVEWADDLFRQRATEAGYQTLYRAHVDPRFEDFVEIRSEIGRRLDEIDEARKKHDPAIRKVLAEVREALEADLDKRELRALIERLRVEILDHPERSRTWLADDGWELSQEIHQRLPK
ncbi:hypothetical protein ACFL59_10255 [Planctomycetota bacterium]